MTFDMSQHDRPSVGPYKPVGKLTRAELCSEVMAGPVLHVLDASSCSGLGLRRLLVAAELQRRDMAAIRRHKKRASSAEDRMAMVLAPALIARLEKLLELLGGRE